MPEFIKELRKYDALVYIHPDMASSSQLLGNPDYLENLRLGNQIMIKSKKPVFFFPWSEFYSHYLPNSLTATWIQIPSREYKLLSLNSNDLQAHVDFMAEQIRKEPEEITIAAGGMALGVCVTDLMTCWCSNLYGPYSSLAVQKSIGRKFKEGTIIPNLTDISSILL